MAERSAQNLFDKIHRDLREALRHESDSRVFEWIYMGSFLVVDYIGYTSMSQNASIFQESQTLMHLDMKKYQELVLIDCVNLLSAQRPTATRPHGYGVAPQTLQRGAETPECVAVCSQVPRRPSRRQ